MYVNTAVLTPGKGKITMPILPYAVEKRSARFADQKWLLDAIIKLIGPEWDQSRITYMMAPCSPDTQIAFAGLRSSIKKYDDIAPEMTKVARRMELRAKQALQQGHAVTAGDHFFAAAILYGGAQWPIFDNTPFNLALGEKKNECYGEYVKLADHHIEKPATSTCLPATRQATARCHAC